MNEVISINRLSLAVVSGINEDATYDYVFGGPRSAVSHSTLKLTSPPVRLRPDGKFCKSYQCHLVLESEPIKPSINIPLSHPPKDTQQRFSGSLDDGRTSSSQHSHFHYQQPRRSPGNSLKHKRCLIDARGSRTSLKSNGDDEDTLRQLLNEWVFLIGFAVVSRKSARASFSPSLYHPYRLFLSPSL